MKKLRTNPPRFVNRKDKWDESIYFRAYEMARSGMSETRIAEMLGTTYVTWVRWKDKYPALVKALEAARSCKDAITTFKDYVYSQLPTELQTLWKELQDIEEKKLGREFIEAVLKNQGIRVRQHLWVHALIARNFNASDACRITGIAVSTLTQWMQRDKNFAALVDQINWHKGNFFEAGLVRLVAAGDSAATIYANKTFNRDRGYGDKQQVDHNHNVVVKGVVRHEKEELDLTELDLDPRTMRIMLTAIRKRRQLLEGVDDEPKIRQLPEHVEDAEYAKKEVGDD